MGLQDLNNTGAVKSTLTPTEETPTGGMSPLGQLAADKMWQYAKRESPLLELITDTDGSVTRFLEASMEYNAAQMAQQEGKVYKPGVGVTTASERLGEVLPDFMPMGMLGGKSAKGFAAAENKFSSRLDKKARFEIDDSAAKLNLDVVKDNEFSGKIGDLLDHPELYKQYPEIKDIEISVNPLMEGRGVYSATGSVEGKPFIGVKGKNSYKELIQAENKYRDAEDTAELIWSDSLADTWDSKESLVEYIKKQATREIEIASSPVPKTTKETILHEIQHHIQDTEDFAKGGSMAVMKRGVKKELDGFNDQLADLNEKLRKSVGTDRYSELMAERSELVPKIQQLEGTFGDISSESHNRYLKLAGEFEARDTASRAGLTALERVETPVYSSEDIPLQDLIIRGVE